MDIDHLAALVREWASRKPNVSRAHLFGSRVRGEERGDNHPDGPSDLDIALEVDNVPEDPHGAYVAWMFDTEGWEDELTTLTGVKVDLRQYRGPSTPIVHQGIERSSILVYERRPS
ncbi:nucleotidyltransferase family protein [Lysobacter auxotrophicus]|uniref:Nucleotidyltransferase domain-containing protein n=1 Tax=Lysobacter auxotrophicus TaxID=2992573 RepID=A0ABN6UMA5_9GAMM|nr:nucleotidyltransferase domain-containing protein [Lysobacter auxotrophicus]BDU17507.1 nucleotidyltransferase domain-containing protein [Lysobacter auxotrophicus]